MIVMIGSIGGHLNVILEALPLIESEDVRVITFKNSDDQKRLVDSRFCYIMDPGQSVSRYLINSMQALLLFLRFRPRVIVSVGAGVAVPFCIIANFFGKPVIHIELACQIYELSKTGRFLSKISRSIVVQNKNLHDVRSHRYHLFDVFNSFNRANITGAKTEIQKIFVVFGNAPENFTTLAMIVSSLARLNPKWNFLVQTGFTNFDSHGLSNLTINSFMEYGDVLDKMRACDVVICHSGIGTILDAFRLSIVPVVVPRRVDLDEHTDPSQVILCNYLEELGLIETPVSFGDTDVINALTRSAGGKIQKLDKGQKTLGQLILDLVEKVDD